MYHYSLQPYGLRSTGFIPLSGSAVDYADLNPHLNTEHGKDLNLICPLLLHPERFHAVALLFQLTALILKERLRVVCHLARLLETVHIMHYCQEAIITPELPISL